MLGCLACVCALWAGADTVGAKWLVLLTPPTHTARPTTNALAIEDVIDVVSGVLVVLVFELLVAPCASFVRVHGAGSGATLYSISKPATLRIDNKSALQPARVWLQEGSVSAWFVCGQRVDLISQLILICADC